MCACACKHDMAGTGDDSNCLWHVGLYVLVHLGTCLIDGLTRQDKKWATDFRSQNRVFPSGKSEIQAPLCTPLLRAPKLAPHPLLTFSDAPGLTNSQWVEPDPLGRMPTAALGKQKGSALLGTASTWPCAWPVRVGGQGNSSDNPGSSESGKVTHPSQLPHTLH